ncbi:hypothetical protein PsAD2_04655 [Pseudovibrio axinellae]|uniref:Uncharacterized protein n=1 Tax=Pseudovibrio axinellae TaxID=989403 RepID=A0A165SWJ5_9HYPH|nr:hypothetical protein [Pseudovibrio axinellae]KZL04572.1 hypothetical protein PsAD2_04655 [Pseudovibrio axinellae]SEQ72635.1 hypothetical protein SAMN05421798_10453 [Pseudovibrio axinellae]
MPMKPHLPDAKSSKVAAELEQVWQHLSLSLSNPRSNLAKPNTQETGMVPHFQVYRRNIGHWDINSKDGRLFRLRGGPGEWEIFDERKGKDHKPKAFKDQSVAMAFVCSELMHELILAEGQEPKMIEAWNVSQQVPSGSQDGT